MTGMIKARSVILCGGSGTGLWPLSRSGFPMQFLCLTTKKPLSSAERDELIKHHGHKVMGYHE